MPIPTSSITRDADRYWGLLKDLPGEVKMTLIARLSSSMLEKASEGPVADDEAAAIDRLCGAWKGDETAEEIMQIIEGDRRSRVDPPVL